MFDVATSDRIGPTRLTAFSKTSIRVSKQRLIAVMSATVYPFLLLWVLKELIAPTYGYIGYFFVPPVPQYYGGLSIALAIAPAFIIPLSGHRPGNIMIWLIYVLAYVPCQIIPVYSSGYTFDVYFPLQLSLVAGLGILIAMSSLPAVRMPSLAIGSNLFWGGVWVFTAIALAAAVVSYGFPTHLPSLTDVYDVRAEFKDQNLGVSQTAILLVTWQQKVISPLLIAYGVVRRSPVALASGIMAQLLLFGINGQKSVFFSGLMVIAVIIALSNRGRWLGPMVALGSCLLVLGTALVDLALGSPAFTSMFVRRLILTPGLLTGYYYEFFSASPQVHLSNSVLSGVFQNPYDVPAPYLIGQYFFGRPEMSANANFWADGYANFGFMGIIGFSIILGAIIWVFNSFALDRPMLIAGALAGMCAWSLTDTALFTSLRTHGILFAMIVLFLMPRVSDAAEKRASRKKSSALRLPSSRTEAPASPAGVVRLGA